MAGVFLFVVHNIRYWMADVYLDARQMKHGMAINVFVFRTTPETIWEIVSLIAQQEHISIMASVLHSAELINTIMALNASAIPAILGQISIQDASKTVDSMNNM